MFSPEPGVIVEQKKDSQALAQIFIALLNQIKAGSSTLSREMYLQGENSNKRPFINLKGKNYQTEYTAPSLNKQALDLLKDIPNKEISISRELQIFTLFTHALTHCIHIDTDSRVQNEVSALGDLLLVFDSGLEPETKTKLFQLLCNFLHDSLVALDKPKLGSKLKSKEFRQRIIGIEILFNLLEKNIFAQGLEIDLAENKKLRKTLDLLKIKTVKYQDEEEYNRFYRLLSQLEFLQFADQYKEKYRNEDWIRIVELLPQYELARSLEEFKLLNYNLMIAKDMPLKLN